MRTMIVPQFGPPSVLAPADRPEPACGPGDLLLRVHASAVNPVDTKVRSGKFRAPRSLPLIPGYDVCGTIERVGSDVTGFKVGDAVYAFCNIFRDGSAAELVAVDARAAALKPGSLDAAHAAAVPLVLVTAWEALHTKLRLAPGETVLVQAGAGGVGHVAIQLAKLHGCTVYATASRDDSKQLCADLGADAVIDYKREDLAERARSLTNGKGVDVALDCAGGPSFAAALACVGPEGRIATIVGVPVETDLSPLFLRNGSLHTVFIGAPYMHGVSTDRYGTMLTEAAKLLDAGKLRIRVSHTLPLAELAHAHELQETGHTLGKIAITVK